MLSVNREQKEEKEEEDEQPRQKYRYNLRPRKPASPESSTPDLTYREAGQLPGDYGRDAMTIIRRKGVKASRMIAQATPSESVPFGRGRPLPSFAQRTRPTNTRTRPATSTPFPASKGAVHEEDEDEDEDEDEEDDRLIIDEEAYQGTEESYGSMLLNSSVYDDTLYDDTMIEDFELLTTSSRLPSPNTD